ncbi:MAG: hypothetical protein U9N59_07150 [Campylobacterota bacterium]|nr:hypothetical protein [Campylobacterota bacterium]
MQDFDFKEYLAEIVSSVVLLASALFLFSNVYYLPMTEYKDAIKKMKSSYVKTATKLKQEKILREEKKEDKVEKLSVIPGLLKRINDTCKAPKIIIRELQPDDANPFKFELKFVSGYFDFLKVLSEFEKLNIAIDDIAIYPFEIDKNNPKHFITLNIRAIGSGEKIDAKLMQFLDEELAKKDKRNPFQRFAKLGKNIQRIIDLTWIHKLSGIGRVNGENMATINHQQYFKGDIFNGYMITSIGSDGVKLKKITSNGNEVYIINFRKIKI